MPIQTSTVATAGNLTQYETEYMLGVLEERLYDQFATPVGGTFEPKGLTVSRQWLGQALPTPTASVASETIDFEPKTIADVSDTFNKVAISDGIQAHWLNFEKSSLMTPKMFAKATGQLAIETIDAYARRPATEGTLVYYGGTTSDNARSNLDLGTAGHWFSITNFVVARSLLGDFGNTEGLFVVCDNFQYGDLIVTAGGSVTSYAAYTERAMEKLFNYEMGELMGVRIVVATNAKKAGAAGAANAAPVSTTIATSATANLVGSTTIEVAANTNIAAGMWLTVGTVQTAGASDATEKAEIVRVASISATTITIVGSGPRNGLKRAHAVGDTVKNADVAHLAVFGVKDALAVDFGSFGRYGKIGMPFEQGNAHQWTNFYFNYYGKSIAAFSRN